MPTRWKWVSLLSLLLAMAFKESCCQTSYNELMTRFARASRGVNKTFIQTMADKLDNFKGITRKDIVESLKQYSTSVPSVSPQCQEHIVTVLDGVTEKQTWAYQMLDSFGKPGAGLMRYMFEWFGSYDECMSTVIPNTNTSPPPFEPKYCLAVRPLAPSVNIELGTCFPSTCNETDIILFVSSLVKEISPVFTPTSAVCNRRPDKLDQPAIASLVVLSIFAVLLIIGTGYDVLKRSSKTTEVDTYNVQTPTPVSKTTYDDPPTEVTNGHPTDINASVDSLMVSGEYTRAPLLGSHFNLGGEFGEKCAGIFKNIILSFSLYTNGAKLFSTETSAGTLRAVHGIRFLSMTWVILGHTYFFGEACAMYANFAADFPKIIQRWTFDAIQYATVSVDTFFVLSGLLVVYLALDQLEKGEGRLNWFLFYFHRYIRLTPPYMFVIMLYVPLFKYWGSGPVYPLTIDPFCKNNFWLNLLYVQNLARADQQCMGWAWYLANDMQFYVLSPLIFVPLYFYKWVGLVVAGVFLVATVTAAGVITSAYGIVPTNFADYMTMYYVKPYCRMGPYIIGMLAGYVLFKSKCRIRMNKLQVLLGWGSAAGICLAVLYGQDAQTHGHVQSMTETALYNALSRTAWGVGVAWVIVACATGNGGFVNTLLSWRALIPLSKLTYCAYLVHPIIMMYYFLSRRTPVYVTDTEMIYLFFGNLVASYMVATVVSLMFESPVLGIERAILKRERK